MGISYRGEFDEVNQGSYISKRITVGSTEVKAVVGASALTARQELIIFNDSTEVVYFGPTGVTVSGVNKGIPLDPQETVNLTFGEGTEVYLITATSADVIIQEVS